MIKKIEDLKTVREKQAFILGMRTQADKVLDYTKHMELWKPVVNIRKALKEDLQFCDKLELRVLRGKK